jgi:uncharacterized protein
MRNGLQDYECLWLLEDKIAQLRAGLDPSVAAMIVPNRRSLEIAAQVVRSYSDCEHDAAAFYRARQQVIDELMDLDRSPRVVLQTNPLEHSAVAGDGNLDVHGWAEPGTRIKINGHATSIAADGSFLADARPGRDGLLTVQAENGSGQKTLVRRFKLLDPRR